MQRNTLHQSHQRIDPNRITFCRELKGLTKKALAEKIDRSPSCIMQYEAGTRPVPFDVFERLVNIFDVSPEFLTTNAPCIAHDVCHFRANRRVSQVERLKARSYALIISSIYRYLEEQGILFPELGFVPCSGNLEERDMDTFALRMRQDLGLGLGPIPDMAALLEKIGVRIILLPESCAGLDAFAFWIGGKPCICISYSAASRMQFDYAHEFAHLLLDGETVPGDTMAERRAHRFAAAFLMPSPTFRRDCPHIFRRPLFLSVKQYWHVSIGAALYRARELGIMNERTYLNAIIAQNKAGERKNEPGEFSKPMPTLLGQALDMVAEDITLEEMADALTLTPQTLLSFLQEQMVSATVIQKMGGVCLPEKKKATVLRFYP